MRLFGSSEVDILHIEGDELWPEGILEQILFSKDDSRSISYHILLCYMILLLLYKEKSSSPPLELNLYLETYKVLEVIKVTLYVF